MDIIEYAKEMELEGERMYRQMASETNNAGLKKILTMLADDEVRHYKYIENLDKAGLSEYPQTTVLGDAKENFQGLQDNKADVLADVTQQDLYRKSVDLEKKAMETYESKAAESQDADEKKLLELLAKEEKRHYFLLQNLLDFIQEPQRYLDDAEFSRLDDSYAGVV